MRRDSVTEKDKRSITQKKEEASLLMRRSRETYKHMLERVTKLRLFCDFNLDELRTLIRDRLGTPCRYCGERIRAKNFALDHVEPISRGGLAALSNCEIICAGCNRAKGILTKAEFLTLYALLNTWSSRARNNTLGRLKAGGRMATGWMTSGAKDKTI